MFNKIRGVHISEYPDHKHISDGKEIINYLEPEFVYIPLIEGGSPCEIKVNEGAKVAIGQTVAMRTGRFGLPVHSSISGTVVSCNKKMWHSSGKLVDCIQIKNDFEDRYYENLQPLKELTPESIADFARQSGIVGLGGSGFPTFVKYQVKTPIDYVVINGAECEPFITGDYRLMIEQADELIRGIKYIMIAVNAPKAVVAIKKNKQQAIDAVNKAIQDANEQDRISVFLLKDEYPAGWEKYIVQRVTGKNYNGLPAEAGAVVNNVATAITLAKAIETGVPLVEKVVTFTGYGLNRQQNVRVRVGTNCADVINMLGGYSSDNPNMLMIAGGPMTGSTVAFENLVVNRSLGSVLVMPKVEVKEQPCLGCGKCAAHCPVHLTPTQIKRVLELKDVKLLETLKPNKCVQCGLCSYVCPSRISLTEAVGKAKMFVMKK